MRHELKVNRSELVDGLNTLRKSVKRKTKSDAVFTFEKGKFVVFLDGVAIEASAGGFPGMVRIAGIKALNLSQVLPPEDPLTFGLDGDRLFIGSTFSMPCVWHNVTPNPIQLPMDPPLPVLLGMRLKYTDEEIAQSGLTDSLAKAEARGKALVGRATNALEPLGVAREDIERLVGDAVKRINKL